MSFPDNGAVGAALSHVVTHCFPKVSDPVVLVAPHGRGFWRDLAQVLRSRGIPVIQLAIDRMGVPPVACIPRPKGPGRLSVVRHGTFSTALVIVGTPLGSAAHVSPVPRTDRGPTRRLARKGTATMSRALAELEASGTPVAIWDWPVDLAPARLRDLTSTVYLRALHTDYEELRARNQKFAKWISAGSDLQIRAPGGTAISMVRGAEPIIQEGCQFTPHDSVFQLPGGEVFFTPVARTAEGNIETWLRGRRTSISVHRGVGRFPPIDGLPATAPLIEFGLGTNASAIALRSLSLGEKALGTCHFGFGDPPQSSRGRGRLGFHFDVVVENPQVSIA